MSNEQPGRVRLPALLVLAIAALGACDNPATMESAGPLEAAAFAGGIPIGPSALPNSEFGDRFNGSHRNMAPADLLASLAAIQARGGAVTLILAGGPNQFKDADGHFSLGLWQARVDRFRDIDFSAYIKDGTVFGHYLVDEPNDASNWNGVPIPGATVEAMARYSKEIWPDLPTVVRTEPGYLAKDGTAYYYLDAAWAQYVARKGEVGPFLDRNVADARNLSLELVVGLNLLAGGPGGAPMTVTEVRDWGSVLLSSSYPCAFVSYRYDAAYLAQPDMGTAMDHLRSLAQNRTGKSCRASRGSPGPAPDPTAVEISWSDPVDITYGTALGEAQLNAAATAGGNPVAGAFTYEPAAGAILNAGEDHELKATFTPSDPEAYQSATASVRLDVLKAPTTLSWSVPASTTVGPLSASLLTAIATAGGEAVQGTFTYAPAAGEFVDASQSRSLSVSFQPSSANYAAATKSVSLGVLYPWSGFFEPTNNAQVLNEAKAGSAIPIRFSLGGDRPAPVLASGSPEVKKVKCPSWATDAIEETEPAPSSSIRYESTTGQYVYTWKTQTNWAGGCRLFRLVLKDGTSREAYFRFSR